MRIKQIDNNLLKRIHINRHTMNRNKKQGLDDPPIGIEISGQQKQYASRVWILGPSEVIHSQHKPLKCGAKCWIETHSPVEIVVMHSPSSKSPSSDEAESEQPQV